MNTHLHVTAWALLFILFVVILLLHKQGKENGAKIVHMILRLDYLLILYSGGMLFSYYLGGSQMGEAVFKGIAGIWVIISIEKISINTPGNEPTKIWWLQLVIGVLITFILGFGRLHLGFL